MRISLPCSLVLLTACTSVSTGPRVVTSGDSFFDRPWPSDTRTVDGHPDLSDFTQAQDYPLLDGYLVEAATLDGFGTNSPIFLRFDAAIDTERLPTPAESASVDSAVMLIDIDIESPERGQLRAIEWDFQEESTRWQPQNLLAVQPVWGMPLRPSTRYALVVTTEIARRSTDFDGIWHHSHANYAEWRDLAETLRLLHIEQNRIAFATQFTTQDTTSEMARIVHRVQEGMRTDTLDQEMELVRATPWYTAWSGHTRVPIFQHGEAPYLTTGGAFQFDESGWPELAGWESVELVISVPVDQEEPDDGWPVVLYVHGTGGSARGFADGVSGLEVASVIAGAGAVGMGISLPFHGDRDMGVDPALVSFNYFNASAGRSNFRQAAVEQIWLIEALFEQTHRFWGSHEDGAIDLRTNPAAIAYMGHSHGGELGILAAPFLGHRVQGIVLSGAGGGLSISAVHRDADDYPIQQLLRDTFDFDDDEELDELHPIIGMIQFVGEVTDPLNYSPYWHRWRPAWAAAPVPVLFYEGLLDVYTPPAAIEALAGAAHSPIVAPVEQRSTVQELQGIDGIAAPVSLNLQAWDGSLVTGGLAQYEDEGHYAVFNDVKAARRYRDFLHSSLYDQPTITNGDEP